MGFEILVMILICLVRNVRMKTRSEQRPRQKALVIIEDIAAKPMPR